jgi:hypothetical protein
MAGELQTTGATGLTIKAIIWDETGQRWNGAAFAAVSTFSAAQWLASGVVACTEAQDSEANAVGVYVGDWPAITAAADYIVEYYQGTVAVGNLHSKQKYNPVDEVTLADGAHGGASAALTLADYSDFTGAGATNPNVLLSAEIATVASQTSFTLATGSDQDDAYNDQQIVLYDDSNSDYPSVRTVSDYTGSTKTVTINSAPDFTLGTDDSVKIFVSGAGTTNVHTESTLIESG